MVKVMVFEVVMHSYGTVMQLYVNLAAVGGGLFVKFNKPGAGLLPSHSGPDGLDSEDTSALVRVFETKSNVSSILYFR